MENKQYILRIDCPDEKGLVHKITGVLYHHDLNVLRTDEYVDRECSHFFMRTEFTGECQEEKVINGLKGILPDTVNVSLNEATVKKVILLATKEHHCLSDLLIRNAYKDINIEILAVIANHQTLRPLVERFGLPFHYISHEGKTREAHEEEVLHCIASYQPDYLVLAKYMRILSAIFEQKYPNRIINIHHSFLPAFIGANPYKQAHQRGVKIIGATAHFVNENLDEGPIITQDIIRVNHANRWQDMARAGRDVEKIALARALKLVFEDRVFVKDNKTVIFE
jgi:formyltetrahydrofolate deformylase